MIQRIKYTDRLDICVDKAYLYTTNNAIDDFKKDPELACICLYINEIKVCTVMFHRAHLNLDA